MVVVAAIPISRSNGDSNINNNKFASPFCHLEIGDFEFRIDPIFEMDSSRPLANMMQIFGPGSTTYLSVQFNSILIRT